MEWQKGAPSKLNNWITLFYVEARNLINSSFPFNQTQLWLKINSIDEVVKDHRVHYFPCSVLIFEAMDYRLNYFKKKRVDEQWTLNKSHARAALILWINGLCYKNPQIKWVSWDVVWEAVHACAEVSAHFIIKIGNYS